MHHARIAFEQRAFEIDAFFTHYCYRRGKDKGKLYTAIFAICRERLATWSSDHSESKDTVHDLTATVIGDIYSAMLKADLESMEHAYNYAKAAARSKAFDHRASYEAIALKSKRDQALFKRRHIVESEDRIEWDQPERAPGYEHHTKRELAQLDPTLWQMPPMACVSLDTPLGDDLDEGAPTTIADTLVDPTDTPAEALERNEETNQRFAHARALLSPPEQQFFDNLVGIIGERPLTAAERQRLKRIRDKIEQEQTK